MRRLILLAVSCSLAACSSVRHQGYFHPTFENTGVNVTANTQQKTADVRSENLVASTEKQPVLTSEKEIATATTMEVVRKTYLQMDKAQRKEFRKEVKAEVKKIVKAQKGKAAPAQMAGGMDHDLKLAAIFGAVGIVALIIGGDVFWIIGGIALLIGVVFFVKWLVRQ